MSSNKLSIINYPFTAISAQTDFKLALILCMIDPTLGGVLVLGDKGTGKTTTVRALYNLMKKNDPDFSFVNLPIGATEDRVLGSVKLDVLISEKRIEIHKGLLAKANKGILYIDEINLLNDYLMDVLLDAASSGGYYLERDSVSQWLESKFCLVGTMNPEEGELRPQLLDRFGLSVTIKTPTDKAARIKIMNRRLSFDTNPIAFTEQYEKEEIQLSSQIQLAKTNLISVIIPDAIKEEIAGICIDNNVEGLRADILLMKAARAYAAFNNQKKVCLEDVQKVKNFVLSHRVKPKSQHGSQCESNQHPPQNKNDGSSPENQQEHSEMASGLNEYLLNAANTQQYLKIDPGNHVSKKGVRLKAINQQAATGQNKPYEHLYIDLLKTVKDYMNRGRLTIKYKTLIPKSEIQLLFLIDSSGSMLQNKQMASVKGVINQTIQQYNNKNISYAIIALTNGTAKILTQLTSNVEELLIAVKQLCTGGKTNLKAGLRLVHQLVKDKGHRNNHGHLFILTDGKINAGESEDPFQETVAYYKIFLKYLLRTTVVDMESGFIRLGLAKQLAQEINAGYQSISLE